MVADIRIQSKEKQELPPKDSKISVVNNVVHSLFKEIVISINSQERIL